MLGSILFAAALAASDGPLDADHLKAAMQDARESPAAAPVPRSFRIQIPFVDGRKRNMPTFQSPARWVYDYKRNQLDLIIGPGEVTAINYDAFSQQGLDKLPSLQSFVFDSREITMANDFTVPNRTRAQELPAGSIGSSRGDTIEFGVRSRVSSFAIAVPHEDNGVSSLPKGFKPLNIHKVKGLPQGELRRYVQGLTLVLEGQTTNLGQKPPMFCGGFQGGVTSRFTTGDKLISIYSKQCFVTARIDAVTVMRGNQILATWPQPAAAAD